ncbi:hypothetical protein LINPERHAP1_LOCUS38045 [Linum perenne]
MYEVEDERLGSLKEKESQPSQYHGFNPVPAALTTLLKEGLPSKSAEKPPMNVIRQNLEMMSSMLKNNVDSISPEMRREELQLTVANAVGTDGNWNWEFLRRSIPHHIISHIAGMEAPCKTHGEDDIIW